MAKGSSKGASKVAPVDPRLASAPPAKGGPCGLCCGSREPAYKPGQSAEEASEQRDQARKARVARRRLFRTRRFMYGGFAGAIFSTLWVLRAWATKRV